MKGVILAGGTGSRMYPSTKVTNKHLLSVYNKPMIFHPIETLKKMGIKEILIVSGKEHAGHIINLLGSGSEYGLEFTYRIQDEAGGIAQALGLAEEFASGNNIAVILGDNIFEKSPDVSNFNEGARIFIKKVPDPQRFGIPEIVGNKIINIEEKPQFPKSDYAITGLYLYDKRAFDYIKRLTPSQRGELELTDVMNFYIQDNLLDFGYVEGFWSDAGTFESLFRSSEFMREKEKNEEGF